MSRGIVTGLVFFTLLLVLPVSRSALAADIYQSPENFLLEVFDNDVPDPQIVWLTGKRGDFAEEILGHKPNSLRTRYWAAGGKTAWILHEIGKEKSITVGLVIGQTGINQLQILVYRENRGAEIRFPFFTDQFTNIKLTDNMQLDRRIDNITGATLSVAAVQRISRLALFLHQEVMQ